MAYHRISQPEARHLSGFIGRLRGDDSGELHKQACAMAASAYQVVGKQDHFGYCLFHKLATYQGPWHSELETMASVALRGLARLADGRVGEAVKQASFNPRDWTDSVLRLAQLYPQLLTASAALGLVGGGLHWGLGNSPSKEDNLDDEKRRAQIDTLNDMTNDMETELRRRGYDAA